MSEENKLNSSKSNEATYDKAKGYWQTVEPTICGMLGGIPEVGFIGKQLNFDLLAYLISMTI